MSIIKKTLTKHWIALAALPGLIFVVVVVVISSIAAFQSVAIYKTYRDLDVNNIHLSEVEDLSKSFRDVEKQFNGLKMSYDVFVHLMIPFMHYPLFTQEINGMKQFFTDVEELISWSHDLLIIAEDMDSLQSDIHNVLDSNIDLTGDMSTYITRLEKATFRLQILSDSMNISKEPSRYGLIVKFSGLGSRFVRIDNVLNENVDVALTSSKVLGNIFELVDEGDSIFNQLRFDLTKDDYVWDFEALRGDVEYIHFMAMKALGSLYELDRYDKNINPVSSYREELYAFLSLTLTLCDSVKSGLDIIEPLKSTAISDKFLTDGSLVNVINELNESSFDLLLLQSNINRLENELNRLSKLDTFTNRQDISVIQEMLPDIKIAIDFGVQVFKHGGEFIGIGAERKYLILGHSSDEIRGTGGFVSAIWLMVWNNGRLSDVQYYDTVEVDDMDRIAIYPEAPKALRKHMNAWAWLMRDISWDPDFPTTSKNAIHLFNLGQGVKVDGVIGINQWSLNKLVDAVGGIVIEGNGKPVSSKNLISLLEQGTDEEGRQFTDKIMNAFIDQVQSSNELARLLDIGVNFKDSLDSKNILISHNSADIQKTIEDFGWSGSINSTQNDFIYIVDSNVGWSKSDRNVERKMHYEVDLSGERITSNLRVHYHNHSAPSAAPCEPQWINRGKSYFDLKNACYWDYIRIYVPDAAKIIYGTPMPLPKMSVAVETGYEEPGAATMGSYKHHGKSVFSGIFTIEHGHSKSLEFVYDLPSSLIESRKGLNIYRLFVQKQPGIQRRHSDFTIKLPTLSKIISVVPEPDSLSGGVILFSDFLEKDFELTIEYRD